tara:strand:- start:31689 stop:33539 length:1851 start_codon:yes stop_codon:yes gene_type:complete
MNSIKRHAFTLLNSNNYTQATWKIDIMRVAVSQFATTSNAQENLATCISMINEAAMCKPSLIVLPEYCNTQPSYVDHNQAWDEALSINGTFLQRIAEQAKKHNCYIVLNVTLQRDLLRDLVNNKQDGSIKSNISVTSCLFSPLGDLVHQADKQALTGHENTFFSSAKNAAEVVTTPFGKLGFLTGSDSMTFAESRGLALHGAQLLCNSMSSFSIDQSSLHDPARACENNVFLAVANKFGQSQILAPNGKVLAKITHNKEGFVFADINLAEGGVNAGIGLNKKFRPDGTQLIKQRRPELYQALTAAIKQASQDELINSPIHDNKVPATANVAIFATYKSNEQAIEDVCHYIDNNLSDIIQLPELFFIADKAITNNAQQLAQIACLSKQLITQVSAVLRPFQYVSTSLVIEGMHQAVLISEHGLFAIQQQLHFCQRYQWTALGDDVNIIELPLEQGNIKVAMLTADDANIPEIVNIAALNNIHLLLVPFDIQEPSEVEYSLLSRAAEHRICIVAASREKSFANNLSTNNGKSNVSNKIDNKNSTYNTKKVKAHKSTGLIANLSKDFPLLTQYKSSPWKSDKFNGYINQPLVKYQQGKITKAVIHPIAACNKLVVTKYF